MMLSKLLYQEVSPEFFRILCGANARIYIDAIDALRTEMGESVEGLSRQTAIEVVFDVVEHHAGLHLDEGDPDTKAADAAELASHRGQAHFILNRLIECGWLSEPQRPDYQRLVYIEPPAEVAIDALRRIATPEHAQFTDRLLMVCNVSTSEDSFDETPWSDLEGCIANAKAGLLELRAMQKSVERLTRRQLAATTLRENLSVLYDEFSDAIGNSCYRELLRVRLPVRLKQAARRLEELAENPFVLEAMQKEVIRRGLATEEKEAMKLIRLRLHELFELLDAIEPQSELMDRRTAEFARRSFARFRYLQEIGSARREQVQAVFEAINERFAGARISELEASTEAFPAVAVTDARLIAGLESLQFPRRRAGSAEATPIDDDLTDEERDACLREMEGNLRDSLTVFRANRFLETLDFDENRRLASSDLPIPTMDEITDVAALLLHSGSADAAYRIHLERETLEEHAPETDLRAGYHIERFEIEKL